MDDETLAWWSRRISEGHTMPGLHRGVALGEALASFVDWVTRHSLKPDELEVWAWGMDFDFPLLKHAGDAAHIKMPWRYSNQRDARTLCKVVGVTRQGECEHRGLSDAEAAAGAVMAALRLTTGREEKLVDLPGDPDFERGWNEYRRQLVETVGRTRLPEWVVLPEEIQDCFAAGLWAVLGEVPSARGALEGKI